MARSDRTFKRQLCKNWKSAAAFVFGLLVWGAGPNANAQAEDDTDSSASSQLMMDSSPLVSSRASGMARALSTVADSNDALFYNPAGIGGAMDSSIPAPKDSIRQFHFPWLGGSTNAATLGFYNAMQDAGIAESSAFATSVLEEYDGVRQYGRLSVFPNVGLGRSIMGPFVDEQVAIVPNGGDRVLFRERTTSGFTGGVGLADKRGRLYLGYSGALLSRTETAGEYDFQQIASAKSRTENTKDAKTNTTATAHNLGLIWQLSERLRPRLAIALRDFGDTEFRKSDGSLVDTIPQDTTVGFSLSPNVGRWGIYTFVLEGRHLTDSNTATNKKVGVGMELLVSRFSSSALLGIRAGYNLAGASAGLHLDLGILRVECATEAHDVGLNNEHVVDRRYVASAAINLAEP